MRLVFAGGGTGGHVYPALAVAEEVARRAPGSQILFLGTAGGLESRAIPSAGFPLRSVWARPLARRLSWALAFWPLHLARGVLSACTALARFKPHVVVGSGGYVSGPAGIAALLCGVPLVLLEQNILPGLVTRLLAPLARRVYVSSADTLRFLDRHSNVAVAGNPLRLGFGLMGRTEALRRLNLPPDEGRLTVLVTGGSQGSVPINEAVLAGLSLLETEKVRLLWQTGPSDFDRLQRACAGLPIEVHLRSYIDEMAAAYAVCDLVVARSGAMTVAELTTCGLPSVLIPLPHAAAGHQTANARHLERTGACMVIPQAELAPQRLASAIAELAADPRRLREMGEHARSLAQSDARNHIAEDLTRRWEQRLKTDC